jgi:hypothetical protein
MCNWTVPIDKRTCNKTTGCHSNRFPFDRLVHILYRNSRLPQLLPNAGHSLAETAKNEFFEAEW